MCHPDLSFYGVLSDFPWAIVSICIPPSSPNSGRDHPRPNQRESTLPDRPPLEPPELYPFASIHFSGRFSSPRTPRIDFPVSPQSSPPFFPLSLLAGALPHAARAPKSGSSGLGPDHPAPSSGKKCCLVGSSDQHRPLVFVKFAENCKKN